MNKSISDRELKERIERLLDFTPNIKIRKLENGAVQVNNIYIRNRYGSWECKGEQFYRRKSAVGFAICTLHNDHDTARLIKNLDSRLQKVKFDIDVYHYQMRKSKAERRDIFENRISADMPYLYEADNKLTRILKSVKV